MQTISHQEAKQKYPDTHADLKRAIASIRFQLSMVLEDMEIDHEALRAMYGEFGFTNAADLRTALNQLVALDQFANAVQGRLSN